MSRYFVLLASLLLASLLATTTTAVVGPLIISDNFSNQVYLPQSITAIHAQLGYTLSNPSIPISPYTLTVYSHTPQTQFYINNAFGQATLTDDSAALGTTGEPISGVGEYRYNFIIPSAVDGGGRLLFNMTYTVSSEEHVQVIISAANPNGQIQ